MTLSDALDQAMASGLERLDAQMLLLMSLERSANDRAWLLAHDTDPLPAAAAARFGDLVRRRALGEPVAYLAGVKAFFGLDLRVDARVLIPRSDTETLVQWVLDTLPPPSSEARFLDLGTGSGAIALAVKSQRPDVQVTATDASADALAVASDNARHLGLEVNFLQGRWLDAVPTQTFHVIASNPPYIAEGDPHLRALAHEPISALTAGPTGLDDLRDLIANAHRALRAGGWLLLEHGHDQALAVRNLLNAAGFESVASRTDLAGIERCSGGRWPEKR